MSSSSSASFSIITAAVAEWVDVHSTKHLGCHPQHPLMLEVQIKPSSHTAVLQLRVPIGLKDYILKQYIYLIISPEQLQSIHVSTKADVPPSVREALADRGSTHPFTSVRFSMGGPTMLVGPTAGNPRLKSHSSELAMDALCSLSLATDITLYVCEGAIPDAHLDAFCSLCDGSFRSVRDNLKTLYSGKGAKVIDRPTNAAESPPSYDELALSSPPPLAGASTQRPTAGKKRKGASEAEQGVTHQQMEDLLSAFQENLNLQWEERLDKRLGETTRAMQEQFTEQLEARLAQTRDEILETAHERDEEAKAEMDEHLDYVVDEKLTGIKIDMQSFVKGELENVDEQIRLDICEGIRPY